MGIKNQAKKQNLRKKAGRQSGHLFGLLLKNMVWEKRFIRLL